MPIRPQDSRFLDFTAAVEEILRSRTSPRDIVERVAAALSPLLSERGWLDPCFRRPVPRKPYSQYLLHLPSDASWSVVSFVWPAGSTTPVHDHGCWGVVGVYEGEETETTFRLRGEDRDRGPVSLERGASGSMTAGGITTVVPPEDVHAVSNRGTKDAVSIHVYGSDIGRQPRHTFDFETGEVRRFVSGYDPPPAS